MCAEGVQFYFPSSNYTAIILLVNTFVYCLTLEQFLIQVCADGSEAQVLNGCIKICSIFKLYNKVLIITNVQYE